MYSRLKKYLLIMIGTALSASYTSCSISITDVGDPDIDDYVYVDEMPSTDMQALYAQLIYPTEAKSKGLEGYVLMKVLIDKEGHPVKHSILIASSEIFIQEAIRLVMSASYTPAKRGNIAVAYWLRIDINFRLP